MFEKREPGSGEAEKLTQDEEILHRAIQLKARAQMPKPAGEWDPALHAENWNAFVATLPEEEQRVVEKAAAIHKHFKEKGDAAARGMDLQEEKN